MIFLFACTSAPITAHAILSEVSNELSLPAPEAFDPSMSIITFPDERTLSVQRRYNDLEIRFYSGLSIEQAPTVQAASLTLHQIPLLNYELPISKILVNPENSQIIFAHVLEGQTTTLSLVQKRIYQIIEEEKSVHERLKAALQ